ncbi:ABC transporter permease [Promicromonospora panici]|uniref:ABC transporter permease n=1 Tax=Promicromonospora panici TaxID=2219658 RepID=UPI00101DC9B5|nr:ABC transporter permease [Promicromonospora panici]
MNDGPLTGTGMLLRLALRRDRFKLPLWTILIAVFVPYFYGVLGTTMGENPQQTVDEMASAQAMLDVFSGPMYGLDAVTQERYFLLYTQEFLLVAALMNILLVVRHTRGEEQTGRAGLIRAGAVGRHAPLTAALLTALVTNAVLGVLLTLGAVSINFSLVSALLFATGISLTGLVLAAVTALLAQLAEHGRMVAGLAGVVLAAASIVRGAGAAGGGDALLWLSPLSWAPLTRTLVDERWWPLAIPVLVGGALTAAAYSLSVRRDVGAGLVPPRLGRARAAAWLSSPLALAWRLQRTAIGWWALALGLLGLVWGSLAVAIQPGMAEDLVGGDVVDGYVSLIGIMELFIVGVMGLQLMSRLHTEETHRRHLPALAGTASRAAWLGSWLAVTCGGIVFVAGLAAVGTAVGAAGSVGDPALAGTAFGAMIARVPELLLLVGVAALLYGLAPRWQGLAWALLAFGMVTRFFGEALAWPDAVMTLSLFQHIPRMPVEPFDAVPVLVLTVLAAGVATAGVVAFRSRDV